MANNSVETDSENRPCLLLVDINRPIELEWELLVNNKGFSLLIKFQVLLLRDLKVNLSRNKHR